MAKTSKRTTAGIYLRISDDKAGDELGVTRQRQDCEKLCADRGWLPLEYQDNDWSAKSANTRPKFKKLLADINAGEISRVVACRWIDWRVIRVIGWR